MPDSLKTSINKADPNVLADELRSLKFGDVLASIPTTLRGSTTAASTGNLATLRAVSSQSSNIPAASVVWAYAKVGTAAATQLTVVGYGVTPAAGQIAVAPNGKIVTLAADAWTNLDVIYLPEKGDQFSVTLPVSANTLTLPTNMTTPGASTLLAVTVVAGGSVGDKIVLAPGSAPAAGQAALNAAKTAVVFAGADAVTSATVTVLCSSAVSVSAALDADSTFI